MSRTGASIVPMMFGKAKATVFGGRRNIAVFVGVLGTIVLLARTVSRRRARG